MHTRPDHAASAHASGVAGVGPSACVHHGTGSAYHPTALPTVGPYALPVPVSACVHSYSSRRSCATESATSCTPPCCTRPWYTSGKTATTLVPLERAPGFRVQGSGFRVQGAGCRVQGAGCRVQGSGYRVQGSGCAGTAGLALVRHRASHGHDVRRRPSHGHAVRHRPSDRDDVGHFGRRPAAHAEAHDRATAEEEEHLV